MLVRSTSVFCIGFLAISALTLDVSRCDDVVPSAHCVAVEAAGLPNAWRIHDRLISGGQPEGETGFRSLRDLGIRTIISVDGLKPDVETARKFNLRYVHLPHGYNSVPKDRATELAKAVRDLPWPIYIHCHHGKHRSPAAATVAAIGAGLIAPDAGRDILATAGTGSNYRGLYQSAETATAIAPEILDALNTNFPESVDPPPLIKVMTELEDKLARLESFVDTKSAELPNEDALLLKELFTELGRESSTGQAPEMFLDLIESSRRKSEQLERLFETHSSDEGIDVLKKHACRHLRAIRSDCKSCHRQFRD